MTVLSIRKIGDPVLRQTAAPVTAFDAELATLVKDLSETLAAAGGAGLAAPQIGVGLRVFALNPDLPGNDEKLDHLVNPGLDFPDEQEQDGPEGCLSIPGIYLDTKRRMNVVAKGLTKHGDPVQIVGAGLVARCIQHDADGVARILSTIRGANWPGLVKVSPH
jgi:peptide deformylase